MKIIISPQFSRFLLTLYEQGFECIPTEQDKNLTHHTSYHCDMQVLKVTENTIFMVKSHNYPIKNHKIIKTELLLGEKYPHDCLLNCLVLDKKLFALKKAIDPSLCIFCEHNFIEIINIKQGYAKCSTLKLNERAIITADTNIAKVCRLHGIDVLEIAQGEIDLPNYNYGFIGGASFVFGNVVYFFGNINLHSDSIKIIEFIKKYNLEIVNLSNDKLIDIGGAIVI